MTQHRTDKNTTKPAEQSGAYRWSKELLSGPAAAQIAKRIDLTKIRTNCEFADCIFALNEGAIRFSKLPEVLNETHSEGQWMEAKENWANYPYILQMIAGLYPEKMMEAADLLLSAMAKQWQSDNHPERMKRVDAVRRIHLYYAFGYVMRSLAMLLGANGLLLALKKHKLTGLVLPLHINDKVMLCDVMVYMVAHNLDHAGQTWWYAGWEPVDVMSVSESLFGVKPKYNNTRVLYETEAWWAASFLESKGLLANETSSIQNERLHWLTPVRPYVEKGDINFAVRVALNILLTILDEEKTAKKIGSEKEAQRILDITKNTLLNDFSSLSWSMLIEGLVPFLGHDGDDLILSISRSDKLKKADKALHTALMILLKAGDIHALSGANWLVSELGGHFLELSLSEKLDRLVVNMKTPEQARLARALAKCGDVYICTDHAEGGLLNLHTLIKG